jgi:hypothetical protein
MNGWRALPVLALLFAAACNGKDEAAPKPKSTGPIEERDGLWYATGTSNLFSGTLTHQFSGGIQSAESVYTNGLKLSQRGWHTNGVLKSEFIFHEGQLAVRRSWDIVSKRLAWKHNKIANAQVQRGFDLCNAGKFVEGYVWFHLAASNGQPDAKKALQQFPPTMTEEQKAEAQAVADQLLRQGEEGKEK